MMLKSLLIGVFLQLSMGLFAQAPGSKEIVLEQVRSYGEEVLRVSFNGDDSSFGEFRVTDSSGKVVVFTPQAELIPSPNYFSVSLENLEAGAYVVSIQTKKGSFTTNYTIR